MFHSWKIFILIALATGMDSFSFADEPRFFQPEWANKTIFTIETPKMDEKEVKSSRRRNADFVYREKIPVQGSELLRFFSVPSFPDYYARLRSSPDYASWPMEKLRSQYHNSITDFIARNSSSKIALLYLSKVLDEVAERDGIDADYSNERIQYYVRSTLLLLLEIRSTDLRSRVNGRTIQESQDLRAIEEFLGESPSAKRKAYEGSADLSFVSASEWLQMYSIISRYRGNSIPESPNRKLFSAQDLETAQELDQFLESIKLWSMKSLKTFNKTGLYPDDFEKAMDPNYQSQLRKQIAEMLRLIETYSTQFVKNVEKFKFEKELLISTAQDFDSRPITLKELYELYPRLETVYNRRLSRGDQVSTDWRNHCVENTVTYGQLTVTHKARLKGLCAKLNIEAKDWTDHSSLLNQEFQYASILDSTGGINFRFQFSYGSYEDFQAEVTQALSSYSSKTTMLRNDKILSAHLKSKLSGSKGMSSVLQDSKNKKEISPLLKELYSKAEKEREEFVKAASLGQASNGFQNPMSDLDVTWHGFEVLISKSDSASFLKGLKEWWKTQTGDLEAELRSSLKSSNPIELKELDVRHALSTDLKSMDSVSLARVKAVFPGFDDTMAKGLQNRSIQDLPIKVIPDPEAKDSRVRVLIGTRMKQNLESDGAPKLLPFDHSIVEEVARNQFIEKGYLTLVRDAIRTLMESYPIKSSLMQPWISHAESDIAIWPLIKSWSPRYLSEELNLEDIQPK